MEKAQIRKLFGKDDYLVSVFRKEGFARRKCTNCGEHFWTLSDRTDCGDTSCSGGYSFIKAKTGNNPWDYKKGVLEWTRFFEKNNHTAIRDYPVVARWRDDMHFTLASIANFQPWVLNGTATPPANPLVVSQPCMRFNDLDNVGKTGRHFSLFTMGGQHAFNSEKLTSGYWMDECIDYNFRFLTHILKIRPEDLTYKEDVWMGGGNFGPSLESFAGGLEIVNSVFMQYRLLPGARADAYEKMPMTVIDVGWGLERLPWFVNGTPTAYDSVFSYVLPKLVSENSVEVDHDLLWKYARVSGLLDVGETSDIRKARAGVAKSIGTSQKELDRGLGRLEALYAVCDHTRALVFALADGALPSNVGGGYNLRNVLRRARTLCKIYSLKDVDLVELCLAHVDYLEELYPRLSGIRGTLEDIVKIELARQEDTLAKGRRLVERMAGSGKLASVETLLELYESHGISPEMVEEIVGESFTIPSDFYLRLKERKDASEPTRLPAKETVADGKKISETLLHAAKLAGVTATRALFYDAAYDDVFEFESSIALSLYRGTRVVLGETLFYPTSGGQEHDTGTINGVKVVDVVKEGPIIVHVLEKALPDAREGLKVSCIVDRELRLDLARHHTATHIINASLRRVLGEHVWQQGAEKTRLKARFDFTHYKPVTREELELIEREANRIVLEGIPITVSNIPRGEAEKLFGFRIYQGGAVPERILRIVNVVGVDVEACGGMHCKNTKDVGFIKIISSERIQDGVCRIEFCAGRRAVDFVLGQEKVMNDSCDVFDVRPDELPKTCKRFFEEWKALSKCVKNVKDDSSEMVAKSILESTADETGAIIADELDPALTDAKRIGVVAKKIREKRGGGVTIFLRNRNGAFLLSAPSNAGALAKQLVEKLGGKSGGGDTLARGILKKPVPKTSIRIIFKKTVTVKPKNEKKPKP